MPQDSIAILDYGSQYTQLIARRVREANVYCEIFPWDASPDRVAALNAKAFILSGGPNSVYDEGAPTLPAYVLDAQVPILGICYGQHLLTQALDQGARKHGLHAGQETEATNFSSQRFR